MYKSHTRINILRVSEGEREREREREREWKRSIQIKSEVLNAAAAATD